MRRRTDSGRGVRVLVPVLVVLLLAPLLAIAPVVVGHGVHPAEAASVTASASPESAPLVCGGDTVSFSFDRRGEAYWTVHVPPLAEAKLSFDYNAWSDGWMQLAERIAEDPDDVFREYDNRIFRSGGGDRTAEVIWPKDLLNLSDSWLHVEFKADSGMDFSGYSGEVLVEFIDGESGESLECLDRPGLADDELLGGNPSMPRACENWVPEADPVNTATGNFHDSWTDLAVPGRGWGLGFVRSYNSLSADHDGPLGFGWTHRFGLSLDVSGGVATVVQESGARVRFADSGSGWAAPARVTASLVDNGDGTFTFTRGDGRDVFVFDEGSGQLLSHSDPNGYVTSLSYDQNGELDKVIGEAGRELDFVWSAGKIVSVADPAGRVVSFGYSEAGDLVTVTNVAGATWGYGYDESHRMTTVREPRFEGQDPAPVIVNSYDPDGRVVSQDDQLGRRTSFSYDSGSTTVTAPDGDVTVYEYANNMLQSRTIGVGTKVEATWVYAHDPVTLGVTSITDPNGHVTQREFDDRGNLTKTINGENETVTVATYGAFDLPVTTTNGVGVTTSYGYDTAGNVLSVTTTSTDGSAAWVAGYEYTDPAHPGDLTRVVDENSQVWDYTYGPYGARETAVDPEGRKSGWEYNDLGWLVSEVAPNGYEDGATPTEWTTTYAEHTAHGDPTLVTNPEGEQSTIAYDANRKVTSTIDAQQRVTSFEYTAAGQLATTLRPDGTSTHTTYWPDGLVHQQIDAAGEATTYDYGPTNLIESVVDPNGDETSYVYDLEGRLTSIIDKSDLDCSLSGGCFEFGYDDADRVKSMTGLVSPSHTTDVTEIGYDLAGRQVSRTLDRNGEMLGSAWVWDDFDRVVAYTDLNGDEMTYGYDGFSDRVETLAYPGAIVVSRSYDNAGVLESVTDWDDNTTSFGFDANMNLDSITYPNGAGGDTYTQDRANRITNVTWNGPTEALASIDYTHDDTGMVTSQTPTGIDSDTATTYGYSELSQLTSVSGEGTDYGYDPAGHLIQLANGTTQSFDPGGQLCWSSPSGASGDCDTAPNDAADYEHRGGSRASASEPNGVVHQYEYSAFDQLASVTQTTEQRASLADSVPIGGDFDGDGYDDIFWYRAGSAPDEIWYGSDTQSAWDVHPTGVTGNYTPIAGDFDGDGRTDIYWYRPGTTSDFLWSGQATRGSFDTSVSPKQVSGTYTPFTGDFDGDGYDDIFWYKPGSSTDYIWYGTDTRGEYGDYSLQVSVTTYRPVTGDFDGDGHDDIFWHNPGGGTDYLWAGTATRASFSSSSIAVAGSFEPFTGDFDGDGYDDIFLYGPGSNPDEILYGTSTRFDFEAYTDVNVSGSYTPTAGDFDGDGHSDIYWYRSSTDYTWFGTDARPVFKTTIDDPPVVSFTYDGEGLRDTKTVDHLGVTTTTTYTWDSISAPYALLIAETTNGETTRYVYGPRGTPYAQHNPDGTITYLHHDQLGSTRLLTDEEGTEVGSYTYDPYGQLTNQTGTAATRFGYAGEYTDTETGFQYLRARYYDPTTGVFLTKDPLAASTSEPFGYVAGNPLNTSDPLGLFCIFGKNPNGSCRGSSGAENVTERINDVAVMTVNAPMTAAGAAANSWRGGDCDWAPHLTVVCYGGALEREGTWVLGNVITTSRTKRQYWADPSFHEHETRHTRQYFWTGGGLTFAALYGIEHVRTGGNECNNIWEKLADLKDGDYPCPE
ncbi:MAG: RHS repeat-associated core domain-containing protein [bacterium]|nr:RHS repeat-associated core domain-containing protein [bacterium]